MDELLAFCFFYILWNVFSLPLEALSTKYFYDVFLKANFPFFVRILRTETSSPLDAPVELAHYARRLVETSGLQRRKLADVVTFTLLPLPSRLPSSALQHVKF